MRCRKFWATWGGENSGFTFLEVLVALCVLSISIVALLNCHTISLRNYVYSENISRATMLAEEKINEAEARAITEIGEDEAQEYDNGLRYVTEEGEFYDQDETELYQPKWRADYWWRSIVEETEYDEVRKVVVEVFSRRLARDSMDIDPWDEEQISPAVRLVTYVSTTNRREDARLGQTPSLRAGRTGS
jgi:prepilin-type N-terminal cleavage/methylation domain-containing protein